MVPSLPSSTMYPHLPFAKFDSSLIAWLRRALGSTFLTIIRSRVDRSLSCSLVCHILMPVTLVYVIHKIVDTVLNGTKVRGLVEKVEAAVAKMACGHNVSSRTRSSPASSPLLSSSPNPWRVPRQILADISWEVS